MCTSRAVEIPQFNQGCKKHCPSRKNRLLRPPPSHQAPWAAETKVCSGLCPVMRMLMWYQGLGVREVGGVGGRQWGQEQSWQA